jgi:hypothetical protein
MTVLESAMAPATAHANATVRLCSAREALWSAESRDARVRGTPGEAAALDPVGEATTELTTRDERCTGCTTARPSGPPPTASGLGARDEGNGKAPWRDGSGPGPRPSRATGAVRQVSGALRPRNVARVRVRDER